MYNNLNNNFKPININQAYLAELGRETTSVIQAQNSYIKNELDNIGYTGAILDCETKVNNMNISLLDGIMNLF